MPFLSLSISYRFHTFPAIPFSASLLRSRERPDGKSAAASSNSMLYSGTNRMRFIVVAINGANRAKKENTICPKVLTTGMPRAYFPLFLTYWSDLKCKLKAEGGEVARIPRKAAEEQAGKPVIPAKTATQRNTLVTAQIKDATEKGN